MESENEHLPNLHPVETILQNFKNRRTQMQQQQQASNLNSKNSDKIVARMDKLENKLDKIMKHFGVK